MYFNIKCIGKLPGPTNEFVRSLVFETGEFEQPKFDCMFWVLKRTLSLRGSFEYAQHMFWLRNKKTIFLLFKGRNVKLCNIVVFKNCSKLWSL